MSVVSECLLVSDENPSEGAPVCDARPLADWSRNTARLLDDLLGSHEEDDFPGMRAAEFALDSEE